MTYPVLLPTIAVALGVATAGAESVEMPVTPGGTLRVVLERGAADVSVHDANVVRATARVVGVSVWRGELDLRPATDGASVELDGRLVPAEGAVAKAIAWALWPFRPASLAVQVAVPRDYSVLVRTDGGAIAVAGLHGFLTAETAGGAIDVRDVGRDVDVRTAGGCIHVAGVGGRVRARTSGGAVAIERVTGSVDAETAGGRIDVEDAHDAVAATTSGGAIDVRVPAGLGADLDAQTWGGRVDVAGPLLEQSRTSDPQHVVGRLNGGGVPLRLRTAGGSIHVGAR